MKIKFFLAMCLSVETSLAEPPQKIDLAYALAAATENNLVIKQARASFLAAEGELKSALAELWPAVDLQGNLSQVDKDRLPSFGGETFGADTNWTVDAVLSYELYTGGADTAEIDAARAAALAERYSYQAAVNDVLLDVHRAFYRVLLAKAQRKVQKQLVELLEEELADERSKLRVGAVSEFNVLRAEVALANSKSPLIRAKNEVRISRDGLLNLLALPETHSSDIIGELSEQLFDMNFNQAWAKAQTDRAEVKREELLVKRERSKLRVVKAEYLPELSAFVSYGADKDRFTDKFSDREVGWTAGLQTNWNIFSGGGTEGRLSTAQAEVDISKNQLKKTLLDIELEVRIAHSALTEARQLVAASKKVAQQAEESLRLARSRFDAGAGTQLDILETQVALTEARTNEVLALHDQNVAVAELKRAIGIPLAASSM